MPFAFVQTIGAAVLLLVIVLLLGWVRTRGVRRLDDWVQRNERKR